MAVAERELNTWYNELLGPFESVLENMKSTMKNICMRYARTLKMNGSAEFNDLMQVASIAVWTAYKNYKSKRTTTFETYCYYKINNSIRRFFEYKFKMIHIPIEAKKKGYVAEVTYYNNGMISEDGMDFANAILAREDDLTVQGVVDFLVGLKPKVRKAVMMRMEFYTMEEVGKEFGTSRQRIHQIIGQAREEYLFYELHGRHRKRGEKL